MPKTNTKPTKTTIVVEICHSRLDGSWFARLYRKSRLLVVLARPYRSRQKLIKGIEAFFAAFKAGEPAYRDAQA